MPRPRVLQIMAAIANATATTAFTEEEIDHFGDTFAYTATDPQALGTGSSSTALSDALVTIMGASTGTGITQFAADQTAKTLSSLSGLKKAMQELDLERQRKGLRTGLLQVGTRGATPCPCPPCLPQPPFVRPRALRIAPCTCQQLGGM